MKKIYLIIATLLITSASIGQIVINEIDADQTGTDTSEFIELKWTPNTSLDGYVVVLFNGSDDQSYASYDLDGKTTDASGFFILASTALISGDDIDLGADNGLQNGADAVTVYQANDTDFPNDTPITLTNLIDVLVYGTGDPDDTGLLTGFGVTTQYDEDANSLKDTESLQRSDDGTTYETKLPTFRAENNPMGPNLAITFPGEGSTLAPTASTSMDVTFTVQNFTVATAGNGDGHIHYTVDGGSVVMKFDTDPITLTGLSAGAHVIYMELVDDSHTPLSPPANTTVNFTIATISQVSTITGLRAGVEGDYYELLGEGIVTYTRTNRNQKYIEDANPPTRGTSKSASGSGILIDDSAGVITTTFNIGDGISGLKGRLSSFNGVLQFVPLEDPGAASSTGNTITPEVATASAIATNWENYESELVEIKSATFVGATGNFATGTNYTINDGTSDLTFRTNFSEADYIGTPIPTTPQNLVVLVAEFNGTPQVTARSLTDLTLRVERNAIPGFKIFPNPVSNGRLTINTLSNADKKIQIFDILGKQVLSTNLKGRELNVSKLNSGVYIIKILEEGKTATRKLVIK